MYFFFWNTGKGKIKTWKRQDRNYLLIIFYFFMWYDGQFSRGNSSGFCYYPKSYSVVLQNQKCFCVQVMSFKLGTIDSNTEAFLILKDNCIGFRIIAKSWTIPAGKLTIISHKKVENYQYIVKILSIFGFYFAFPLFQKKYIL
jgi:hypothetical protein